MLEDLDPFDPTSAEFVEWYDELPLWSAPFGLMVLEAVRIRPGMQVLDVGAGSGFLTVELAERCGASSKVIAVDPWSAALSRLELRLANKKLRNVRLVESNILDAEIAPESIDLIVSNLGLNNFDDQEGALRVCYQCAAPGAELVLATNVEGHMAEFYEIYRATLVELGFSDRLAMLDRHIAHRGNLESVTSVLAGAGFEVTGSEAGSFTMRFADGAALLGHHLIRVGFLPDWCALAPDGEESAVMQRLERNLSREASENGNLTLTIPTLCVRAVKRST